MRKLWCSLGLAMMVGILTLITGLLSDVRLSTTMYRFLVSFVIFGIIGYVLALTLEKKYTRNNLISSNTKGQNVDIVSEQELTGGDSSKQDSFIPLTPDKLEHISARKE